MYYGQRKVCCFLNTLYTISKYLSFRSVHVHFFLFFCFHFRYMLLWLWILKAYMYVFIILLFSLFSVMLLGLCILKGYMYVFIILLFPFPVCYYDYEYYSSYKVNFVITMKRSHAVVESQIRWSRAWKYFTIILWQNSDTTFSKTSANITRLLRH